MDLTAKSSIYDALFAEASEVLKRDNPCQVQTGGSCVTCVDVRTHRPHDKSNALCCHNCRHLGPTGCTVQALPCRVWLCYHTQKTHPQTYIALQDIKRRAETAGIPMHYRGSKEQCLDGHNPTPGLWLTNG